MSDERTTQSHLLWESLLWLLADNCSNNRNGFWTNGEVLLCQSETVANVVADLLDDAGFCAVTGYYDPAEDEAAGITDALTGFWYVDI